MPDIHDKDRPEGSPSKKLLVYSGGVEAEHWPSGQADGPYPQQEVAGLQDGVETSGLVTEPRIRERLLELGARWEETGYVLVELEVGSQNGDCRCTLGLKAISLTHVREQPFLALRSANVDQPQGLNVGRCGRPAGRITVIDGILATAVLLGLVLNAALGWWWADPLAGYVLVYYYAIREALASLRTR